MPVTDPQSVISEWQDFYQRIIGIEADFSNLVLPEFQPGFDRILIVDKSLTLEKLLKACQKHLNSRITSPWNLCHDNFEHERDSRNGTYVIRIKNILEPSPYVEGFPKENCIGLLEEILFYLKYFDENEKLPGNKEMTTCFSAMCKTTQVVQVWLRTGILNITYSEKDTGFFTRQVLVC